MPVRKEGHLAAKGGRFRAAEGGGVALLVALSLPAILLVGLGAVQLQAVFTDHSKTQDVADAAALWGAQQLTITPSGATDRTVAFANTQLEGVKANAAVTVNAEVAGDNTMKVTIDTQRPSFFMNLMPAGGFFTHVESIAEGASLTPLCVLIVGPNSADNVTLLGSSRLLGPQCLAHSNKNIVVNGAALLQGATVEAGGSASGPINPSASTGAPTIDDPFASLNVNFPTACGGSLGTTEIESNTTLPPGVHCRNYEIDDGKTLTLAAGEHYFGGDIEIEEDGRLVGDDVVLVFDSAARLDFEDDEDAAQVNLNGRKSGPLAGFVIIASRSNLKTFTLNSDYITNITGTVYVPNAELRVNGSTQGAAASAWTVLVARAVRLLGSPRLVINANYQGSDVPVPKGVGNKTGTTRLKQ